MKIRPQRALVALLLSAALVACDDDDDPVVPDDPFEQTLNGTVAAFDTNEHTFASPRTGQMTVELTWQDETIDLDLYLTDATCVGYPPNDCTILASSDATTGTTESLTFSVTNAVNYKIWVDNFDVDTPSPYTVEITID